MRESTWNAIISRLAAAVRVVFFRKKKLKQKMTFLDERVGTKFQVSIVFRLGWRSGTNKNIQTDMRENTGKTIACARHVYSMKQDYVKLFKFK